MRKINKSKRATVQIPEGTETYKLLFEQNHKETHWEILEHVVKMLPKSKEDRAISAFNEFVEKMTELYPEKAKQLELLRPLVMKKIINGGNLEDWYFEGLKNL